MLKARARVTMRRAMQAASTAGSTSVATLAVRTTSAIAASLNRAGALCPELARHRLGFECGKRRATKAESPACRLNRETQVTRRSQKDLTQGNRA